VAEREKLKVLAIEARKPNPDAKRKQKK